MLKLWVWHGVLRDYTPGIAFALARDEREAWEALKRADASHFEQIRDEGARPVRYNYPVAFTKYGGA